MRRLLAATTIALMLAPGASFVAHGEKAHACTDHVCHCRAAARTEPSPSMACHGVGAGARSLTLQSTCDHDQDGASNGGAIRPALLPPSVTEAAEVSAPRPPVREHGTRSRPVAPETPPPRPFAS